MPDRFIGIFYFFRKETSDFLSLNFNEIYYSDLRIPLFLGSILLVAVIFKIIRYWLKRDKNSQKYSGSEVDGYYLQGLMVKLLYLIPKLAFALAIVGMLLALTEPFLSQTREDKKTIESRIRVDLRDASTSMAESLCDTKKSKSQVSAEAHLDFFKKRIGKNDRVSFWVFASFPHLMEDFIVDDELYFQQAEDAPWILYGDNFGEFFENTPNWQVPQDRHGIVSGEGGGTNMTLAFQAIIKQFDKDKRRLEISGTDVSRIQRSILIITDAEVSAFPANELEELRIRNVRPYVVLIKTSNQAEAPEFARRVRDYGGEYFDVSNETSLIKAYEAIDRLEVVKVEITRKSFKFPIFQKFILISTLIMVIAILIALIMAPFEIYP
ncbi:MAG: hypothetical protein Q8Q89_04550 [bacterium]|nr:hypothetical protein [bacterium]